MPCAEEYFVADGLEAWLGKLWARSEGTAGGRGGTVWTFWVAWLHVGVSCRGGGLEKKTTPDFLVYFTAAETPAKT